MTTPVQVEVDVSAPGAATPIWADITGRVLLSEGVELNAGRASEDAEASPGSLSLVAVNDDGALSPGVSTGPFSGVSIGTRIRCQIGRLGHNKLGSGFSNFEQASGSEWPSGTAGQGYPAPASSSHSSVRANTGARSLRVQFGAGAAGQSAVALSTGLHAPGLPLYASCSVFVPTGEPSVSFGQIGGPRQTSTVTNTWQRLSVVITPGASAVVLSLATASPSVALDEAWMDSVMLSPSNIPFTTSGFDADFTGNIDDMQVALFPAGKASVVKILAVDALKRLTAADSFRSMPEEQVLYTRPIALWAMTDNVDDTSSSNAVPDGAPVTEVTLGSATGGELSFGGDPVVYSSEVTSCLMTPTNNGMGSVTNSGSGLVGSTVYNGGWAVGQGMAVQMWFVSSSYALPTGGRRYLFRCFGGRDGGEVSAWMNADGTISARLEEWGGSGETITTSNTYLAGIFRHHIVVSVRRIGPFDAQLNLTIDGNKIFTNSSTVNTVPGARTIRIGWKDYGRPECWAGRIGMVAIWDRFVTDTEIADLRSAGSSGFSPELVEDRINRLTLFAVSKSTGTDGSSAIVGNIDIAGASPASAIGDLVATEGGNFFVEGGGSFFLTGRGSAYNQPAAATIDRLEGDATLSVDDSRLINDVTTTRPGGAGGRARNDASVAKYGRYGRTIELVCNSTAQAQAAAEAAILTGSTLLPRLPAMGADLVADPALVSTWSVLRPGDRVTVTGLPPQVPASTGDCIIEGITTKVDTDTWMITVTTSPVGITQDRWQLDSALFGPLDQGHRVAW